MRTAILTFAFVMGMAAAASAMPFAPSAGSIQITSRYPTVTCPGCKQPMAPSPPVPVSVGGDLCDVTYTCKICGATTTRTIKVEK